MFFVFALFSALVTAASQAQTAIAAGQVTSFGSALTSAVAVAVDGSQNAYVLTSTGAVYKETLTAAPGTYTEAHLFTTSSSLGSGIAVDSAGANIYVATATTNSVAQYKGSGTSYTLGTTFSGFSGSTNVAVDASGNVYITDVATGYLWKETLSGSAFTQTRIVTGLGTPEYVAIDPAGAIFVYSGTGTANGTIYKVSGSGTTYTAATLSITGFASVTGLAVDAGDDLFLPGTNTGVTAGTYVYKAALSGGAYTVAPYYQTGTAVGLDTAGNVYLASPTQNTGTKLTIGSGYQNFGSVGPGTPPSMTIAFTVTSSGSGSSTMGTPTVVTQGLTGYDFTLGTGSTCASGSYAIVGHSCTVVVQFFPQASGSRLGAVNFIVGGRTLASSFLGGVGFTPLAAYQSVTLLNTIACPSSCSSSLPNGLSNGRGITVDPAGNVWVANSTAGQILKFPAGSQTPVVFNTTSTCQPVGTAIDGEGNVFYTCNDESNIYELVGGSGTGVAIPISYNGTRYSTDDHLSVDAAGNLYPTSYQPASNLFFKVAAGTQTVSLLAAAPSGARFVGAVTDAAGNTFAPDYNNDILYELPAGSNTLITLFSGAPLQAPHAIAEDAAGSLYVTTTVPGTTGNGNSPLLRFTAGNYTASPASLSVPGGDSLYITPDGDFYTVYSNSTLAVYSRSFFALTYASTPVGQTSASQTVVLENDGTAPLTISPPSTGKNPSLSANFTYDPSSTCPQLSNASAPFSLIAGSSCKQIIEFTPQQEGSISGAVVTTDNSANVAGSTQTINISGSATQGTPTVSVASVSGTLGQSVTLTATISGGGVAPTGAVTFVVASGPTVNATCSGGTSSETCTATYPTSAGLASGPNTITASVVADTNYLASSGTGTLTLAAAPTTSSVTSGTNPSIYGNSVVFTGKVISTYGTPTGTITFYDGATAIGTASLNGSGVGTFTTSTLLGGTHSITIGYGGAGNFATSTSSPAVSQVVNTTTNYNNVLTSSNMAPSFGSNVTFTDALTGVNGVTPTGTVVFYSGTTQIGTASVDANGNATFTTASLPLGTQSITARYGGDTNYGSTTSAPVQEVVGPASVLSALVTSNASPAYGSSVTLTEELPILVNTPPTGTVTFSYGSIVLGTVSVNSSGNTTLTTTALPAGTDVVKAVYNGDSHYNPSTSNPVTETVSKVNVPTFTLASTNASPAYGASVTFTANLGAVGGNYPTGLVSFLNGTTQIGTGTISATGVATFTTTNLPAGSDQISATYIGDNNFNASTSNTVSEIVAKANVPSDVLTTTNANPAFGTSITLTDTLGQVNGTYPTGTVTFYNGSTQIGTGSLANGVATLTLGNLPGGTDPIKAVYDGDNTFNAANSNILNEVVTQATGYSDVLTTSNANPAYGTSVTLTDTFPAAGGVYPTGTVTFSKGAVSLGTGTINASGVATLTTTNLPVGTYNVSAGYAGDGNFASATSNPVSETVTKASGYANVLTSTNANPAYGASITLTDTIAAVNGVYPTGSVTFYNGAASIGTGTISSTGIATLTTSALPAGTDTLSAGYLGDTTFAGSTSNSLTEIVTKANVASNVLTTSNASPAFGGSVTFTDTLAAVNGSYPSGTVTFLNGTTSLGTGTISAAGVATLTTTALPVGTDTITASFPGDNTFNTSTSNAITEIVGKATGYGDVLTTSNASPAYGSSITLTDTIAAVNGVYPTGMVTFYNGAASIGTGTISATGVATLTTSALPAGTDPVVANYGGDGNYSPYQSNTVREVVTQAALASDVLAASPTASSFGQSVTLSDTLTGVNGVVPTGSVSFYNGTTLLSTVAVDGTGTATLNTTSLPVATNTLHATYSSDANYAAATSNQVTVTVGKIAATNNDTATGTGTFGAPSTQVSITIPFTGPSAPTGDITVTDTHGNSITIRAATCATSGTNLTCTATLSTLNDPAGPNTVSVSQAADVDYGGSTGGGIITLNKAAATTGDSVSGTGTYGASTTAITVSIPYTGATTPIGGITVTDAQGNSVSIAASACTVSPTALLCPASLSTANDPVGPNAATVTQAADTNYSGSTGSGTITINKAPTTNTDTATGNGTYGAATTAVTVKIPYAGTRSPTGDVTLSDSLSNTVTFPASSCSAAAGVLTCAANLHTANEPLGANTVSVSQAGDGNYTGSTGSGTITIGPAATTAGDTATGAGTYGAPVTAVTVKIPYAGATAPTGAITLNDTHSNTLTIQASTCTAAAGTLTCTVNLPTANEPIGGNIVLISQAGDSDYAGSSGSGTITISKAAVTTGDTATGTGAYGAPTTPITITIPYTGGAVPSGAITVKDALGNTLSIAASSCSTSGTALTCAVSFPTANEPVGPNTVTVSQAGDSNYSGSTGSGTVTIGKAAATATDTATGTGTYGDATTQVIVTIPFAGVTAPSGAITVTDNLGNTVTVPASACVTSGGALTCTAGLPTANVPTGRDPVTVSQAGDSNYTGSSGTGAITINPAGTHGDDTVTGSGSYGALSTPITVVIPFSGAAPTGLITVADSFGNTVSIAAAGCRVSATALVCASTLATGNEPVGSNPVSVAQAADANHAASTGSGAITIGLAAATANDTATGAGNYGSATTAVTATIPYAGAAAPTGAITLTDSLGNTVTSAASACSAANQVLTCVLNLPTANEPLGANQVTVAEAADANYEGSSGAGTVTISTSPVSPVGGTSSGVQNVTITQGTASTLLTATLAYGGATQPSGAVTFTVNGGSPVIASCSTGLSPEACTAVYPTASLQIGTYTITANEAADANYAAGSATGILTVAAGSVSPILDSISYVGNVLIIAGTQNATLIANITYTGPVPTGALTFNLPGGTPLTATCTTGPSPLACTASYPTASLAPGSYVITALEASDSNYPQGEATALLTVSPSASTPVSPILATGSYVNSVLVPYGTATASLYATIAYNGPPPTGAVTFAVIGGSGNPVQGVCTTGNSPITCTADYPTASLGIGSYEIQVNVAADSNYPAGGAIGTLTISEVAASNNDAVTGNGNYGAPTTPITISIPYSGAVAPTGAITVTDSYNNTVSVQASACTASGGTLSCPANLPTANVPLGVDSASVSEGPDAVYAASTGTGSITIGKATATTTDSATGSGTFGAATSPVTVTIPYAGTAAPTGAITVSDGFHNTATIPAQSCTAASGTLTCTTNLPSANEPLGNNPLTVTQVGDSNYTGSTGTGTLNISKAGATNGDTATGTGTYGAASTPVTVTIPFVGTTAPMGAITLADTHNNTITFAASSCTSAGTSLTCAVTLPTATEPVGPNAVTVSQAADTNFSGSTGTGTVTINKAPLSNADTATGTGVYGAANSPVLVTIPYAGIAAPTGAITVADNLGETTTVQASTCTAAAATLTCSLSLPTVNEQVGPNAVTVSQTADSNYSGSTGTGTVTINKAGAASDTATGTGTYGAASTPVTITIPYSGAVPTGAVTLTDTHGNTLTVSTCTGAGGTLTCAANLPTATDPVGPNAVTVSQAADANHSASTGTGTVTINKAPSTSTDTVTGTGTYAAGTTPVTVTIPYVGSVAPTGAVTISDSFGNTITVPASSCTAAAGVLTCTASLPTSNEPLGANPLTVTQAPDANYSGSTGTGSVTINKPGASSGDTVTGTGSYGAATTPVTVTIPYAGGTTPTGTITVTDTHGNTVTLQASSCTAAKGALTCTANLPTANEPVGSNPVNVTQAPDTIFSGSTGTGSVAISKAPATTADTVTGSGNYGAATAAVTVSIPYAGAVAPTGAITVTDAYGNTAIVQASSCTAAAGVLTCTVTLPLATEPVGTNTLSVSQAADANYSGSTGSGSVTVGKTKPTLTAPTISPLNSALGTSVTITQTVPVAETGTVTFYNGSTALGTATIANGVATLTTSALPVGTDSITATANGDANYAAATSPAVTDNVGSTTTTVALVSSQSTLTFGTNVIFTATVSTPGTSTVSGTVTFYDGTTAIGTATVSSGSASMGTASLAVGTHAITATFTPVTGSSLTAATSTAVTQIVTQAASSLALTSSQNPAIVGQTVTLSATAPASVAGVTPTGTVTFYDGTTAIGTVPLNSAGVASLSVATLTGGSHNITAVYAGDAVYATSTSGVVAQKVSDYTVGNTTPTMSADPGASAAFNITINPVDGISFSAPVVLTVTGLPAKFTAAFAQGSVTPGSAGASSTMTVQTFAQALTAMEHEHHVKSLEAAAAWACLFPLLGLRRVRRRLPKSLLLLALTIGSIGIMAPLTGCGGGYFGPQPASYTLTVTGTSGTLQRSTTVTLNVH